MRKISRQNNTDNTNRAKAKRFVPPHREDVKKHFTEVFKMPWEADKFYDFYESKGWFVGKNKMKIWKSAANNWTKNARERAYKQSPAQVVERPDRNRNNSPESVKTSKEPHQEQRCDPPPPEFKKMISDLAAKKGVPE